MKALAGIAPERRLPRFARETFRAWFARRRPIPTGSAPATERSAVLFADTFTNHFSPEIGRAAVDVLEAAGFSVTLPRGPLCCGRPLYDFGMLDSARRRLAQVLDALSPAVAAGSPVVVLEPSCAAVFRDELPELFPKDERAGRLARRTFLLAEFLEREGGGWTPSAPRSSGKALVQFHCHQRALFGIDADRRALAASGLEADVPDSGCCGMAGSFGFEKSHFGVSLAVGERVLFPAVRAASDDTLIVADGFSCREQIFQATGRRAVHLAEALRRIS